MDVFGPIQKKKLKAHCIETVMRNYKNKTSGKGIVKTCSVFVVVMSSTVFHR
jgi:hypothetical protein